MHKITLKQFRFLHDNFKADDDILKLLAAGDDFIDVNENTFRGLDGYYKIDRDLIRIAFQQRCGLDTRSWKYYTNDSGALLLNI